MKYQTKISEGERRGDQIFTSENFNFVKQAADNYKKDTGINCHVESVTTVYTTATLDDVIGRSDLASAPAAERKPAMTHLGALARPPMGNPNGFGGRSYEGPED